MPFGKLFGRLFRKKNTIPLADLITDLGMRKKQAVHLTAAEAGLPAQLQPLGKQAVHLVENHRDYSGFSKMGGPPDLPDGFEWPKWKDRSLAFLMQLKFSEINRDGLLPLMPRSGLLHVFYDQEQKTWGFDPRDKGSWKLVFHEETAGVKSRRYPQDMQVRYKVKMLEPKPVVTYPPPGDERVGALELPGDDDDLYCDYIDSVFDGNPRHQVGGYPSPVQGEDMDLECELASNGLYCGDESGYDDARAKTLAANRTDWVLLLQIDTDDDTAMMWGDCGRLYFWIRKQDLAARNFADVWMILQCC
jgi:uncharacterized protein YwqG